MRHRKKATQLSRTSSHRTAMLRNLVCSLIMHEKVRTSKAKAKAARSLADRVVHLAVKSKDTASRRQVFKLLNNKEAIKHLFDEVAARFTKENGGYTRLVGCGHRLGDNSEQVYFALSYNAAEKTKGGSTMRFHFKKKSTKSRKKGARTGETAVAAAAEAAAPAGSDQSTAAADTAAGS